MLKFGALATLRGRLPTKDDVKKKRRRRKKKEKKCRKRKIKQRTLFCSIRMSLLLRKRENEIRTIQFYI